MDDDAIMRSPKETDTSDAAAQVEQNRLPQLSPRSDSAASAGLSPLPAVADMSLGDDSAVFVTRPSSGSDSDGGGGSGGSGAGLPRTVLTSAGRLRLQPAKLTRTAARKVVLEALDHLEKENEQLRGASHRMSAEVDQLRVENERLRKELDSVRTEKDHVTEKCRLSEKQREQLSGLHREMEGHLRELRQQLNEGCVVKEKLLEENRKQAKHIDNLRQEAAEKDFECRRSLKELQNLKQQMEVVNKRNSNERNFEILHQVELLKSEKRDLVRGKDEQELINTRLRSEMGTLERRLVDQLAELKNENRRHSVLTKEFNSLLEENNRLKMQLRRRSQSQVHGSSTTIEALNPAGELWASGQGKSLALTRVKQGLEGRRTNTPMTPTDRLLKSPSIDALPSLPGSRQNWKP